MDATYAINISYYPVRISGQQIVLIGGVTQSLPVYGEGGYYIASMPQVKIYGTGSTRETALASLLVTSTASTTIDPMVIPFKSTY